MNRKKGVLPIVLLLIGCMLVTIWVWKQEQLPTAELELESLAWVDLLAEGKPVLLNISSDDCPYCVMMEPTLAQMYHHYSGQAVIRELNLDQCPEAALQLPVRATPTQVLCYADGSPYLPSAAVRQEITFLFYMMNDEATAEEQHVLTVHEGLLTAEQMALILQDLGVAL